MVEIIATDAFRDRYWGLDQTDADRVTFVVEILEEAGLGLRYPYSSEIKGTRYPFRELRIPASGKALRVIYAFDPVRQAVLILGSDKTGDDRWYDRAIPEAERLWEEYLTDLRQKEKE